MNSWSDCPDASVMPAREPSHQCSHGEGNRVKDEPSPLGCVIILDYYRPGLTRDCVQSVLCTWTGPVVVVENGSVNLRPTLPARVRYLQLGGNRGFAGGMNSGIRLASEEGASLVLLLNNDAQVGPGAIKAMFDCLKLNPHLGIVTPVRGPRFGSLSAKEKRAGTPIKIPQSGKSQMRLKGVTRVTGYCMAIRMSCLYQTGLLDEDFFFGREDDELSYRMLAHGHGLAELSGIPVEHPGLSSTPLADNNAAKFVSYNYSRGEILLARKTSKSLLRAVSKALMELFKISVKSTFEGGCSPVELFMAGVRGMRAGVKAPLNAPPALSLRP